MEMTPRMKAAQKVEAIASSPELSFERHPERYTASGREEAEIVGTRAW